MSETEKKKIGDLNAIYNEADMVDRELFANQRSNISLVAGNHYTKRGSKYWNRIRSSENIASEQKIRITKNHIQRITKTYRNNIISMAPGVAILPQIDTELQDQKAAELHQSVWHHIKVRHNLKKKVSEWCQDYIDIGEGIIKVFWDANKGEKIVSQIQDERGNVIQMETMSGDLVFERIWGFNMLRDPAAKTFDECRYIIVRKLVDIPELKKQFGDTSDVDQIIQEGKDDTYTIFDGVSGEFYHSKKGKTMVREYYYRPCADYPNGYYYITTENGILAEDELPLGIFPIVYIGFDEIQTSARSESIIKQLRPYQAEINRCASKMAEHSIVLGDDKIFVQRGTKVSQGGMLSGIRAIQYSGSVPIILQGRTGAQYLEYMNTQISEMYSISGISEDSIEKVNNVDPYAMLFRSMRDKKRFVLYAEKFEWFLKEICEKSLRMFKAYSHPEMFVPIVGKREQINLPEFKSMTDLGYQIELEARSDDIESVLGKQLALNHALQYAAGTLKPEQIGQIIRQMPFVNSGQILSDLTSDHDNVVNDILAMERGEYVTAQEFENHLYIIQRLESRMKQADFKFLNPEIQKMFQNKKNEHELWHARQLQEIQRAQAGFIPTDGELVRCDLYVQKPDGKGTHRIEFPVGALQWLQQKLLDQGSVTSATMSLLPKSAQADIARIIAPPAPEPKQAPPVGTPSIEIGGV